MKTLRMEEMTAPAIKEAIGRGFATAVVGVGSTEQHGPHLPTMTDTRIAEDVANRVASKLGNALQARTISVGVSDHHIPFGGTISLRTETLRMIVLDYVRSLAACGFERIVFLPCHGGNFETVAKAVEEARAEHPGVKIVGYTDLMGFTDALNALSAEFGVTEGEAGAHAGENETSMMMALANDLVLRDRFAPGYLGELTENEVKIIFEKGMPALTANGVLGDPAKASARKGEIYLDRIADFLVQAIEKG
jgi:creatinine amidohydrolase/Fe(II)-dependent formamide hydrolase-like protein